MISGRHHGKAKKCGHQKRWIRYLRNNNNNQSQLARLGNNDWILKFRVSFCYFHWFVMIVERATLSIYNRNSVKKLT